MKNCVRMLLALASFICLCVSAYVWWNYCHEKMTYTSNLYFNKEIYDQLFNGALIWFGVSIFFFITTAILSPLFRGVVAFIAVILAAHEVIHKLFKDDDRR